MFTQNDYAVLLVVRGGYWTHSASHCRSAFRNFSTPSYRLYNYGFRVVRVW
jgi:formylglycine-generating enzyme required for sulfatase activity